MGYRTCSAVACTAIISMGATFCTHHWYSIPSALRMSIAGYAKLAREGQADHVQHRFMYVLLLARQQVAIAEKRGAQPIAPAYKARAEEEDQRERMANA